MKTKTLLFTALAVLVAVMAVPAAAQVDLTRLVIVGDSEGAGFADNCLAKHSQVDSFAAIIARQAGADFQQPLLDEPGIGGCVNSTTGAPGGCMVLASLAPAFTCKPIALKPLNLTLARPYNNLAIGGCSMGDLTRATTASNASPGTCANTIDLVLRNSSLNIGSPVDQALALNPTFMIVEMVGNDILGAVLAGDIRDGVTMTPVSFYTSFVNAALTKLKTKTSNGIIFTTADVTNIPFATTLPPVLTSGGAPVIVGGSTIPLLGPKLTSDPTKPCPAPKGGCPLPPAQQIGGVTVPTLVTLNAAGYLPSGFGIPCAAAPTLPFCDYPLPDAPLGAGKPGAVIYPSNVLLLKQRAADYNTAITAAAATVGYKVYDTNSFLSRMKAGFDFGGAVISAAYLQGGGVSYDGFHVTSLGQAILADDVIQFINANFNATVPRPNLSPYLFNGNSTGGIPPAAAFGPDGFERLTAAIFNPDFQRAMYNFILPRKPAPLGDQPVDGTPVHQPRGVYDPLGPARGN